LSAAADTQKRAVSRKLAEWVTLGTSALVVAGVAGFLIYEALREDSPFVPVHARVLMEQVRQEGGRYVVPVEVRNDGRQTLKEFKIHIRYRSIDGTPQNSDFLIDYLGERKSQKVYLYFDRAPSELRVEVEPFAYQLE
jgi:uncharacterized protein (TIGR02588 family)